MAGDVDQPVGRLPRRAISLASLRGVAWPRLSRMINVAGPFASWCHLKGPQVSINRWAGRAEGGARQEARRAEGGGGRLRPDWPRRRARRAEVDWPRRRARRAEGGLAPSAGTARRGWTSPAVHSARRPRSNPNRTSPPVRRSLPSGVRRGTPGTSRDCGRARSRGTRRVAVRQITMAATRSAGFRHALQEFWPECG